MALILNIDSTTTLCSVALAHNGKLIAIREEDGNYTHAENMGMFIQQVFQEANLQMNRLDAIAVSKGPGSYTGLRIGVSLAKGLCYGLGKPLIAVETLQALAWAAIRKSPDKDAVYLSMLDARRMEVYAAAYDSKLDVKRAVNADVVESSSYDQLSQSHKVYFYGNGADKCKEILGGSGNMFFLENIKTSASNMAELSFATFCKGKFEDVAYFEPYYLKEFVAGKKKQI